MTLSHLKTVSGYCNVNQPTVSVVQIKLWVAPQKAVCDSDYDVNQNYFEMLMRQTLSDLLEKEYISSYVHDGVRMGTHEGFHSLTPKGEKYIVELATGNEK
jgi:hypothetical protein